MSDHDISCPFCSVKFTTTVEDGEMACPGCHEQVELEDGSPIWAKFTCPYCHDTFWDMDGSEELTCPACDQEFTLLPDGKLFGITVGCPHCTHRFYTEWWYCECPECHKDFSLMDWQFVGRHTHCEFCGKRIYTETDEIQCSDCISGRKKHHGDCDEDDDEAIQG